MKPLVALDFDGVICDSMNECMLVSFSAYDAWQAGTEAVLTAEIPLPVSFRQYFRTYRYLVRPAREYWLILHSFYQGRSPLSRERFVQLAGEYMVEMAEFETLYFAVRDRLRSADLDAWLSLHRVYQEFSDGWPALKDVSVPYIVTTRDQVSLTSLLDAFNVSIPPEQCWTRERLRSKAEAVFSIAYEKGVSPSAILFVDDHLEHLREVSEIGGTVFWAEWGFWRDACAKETPPFERLANLRQLMMKPAFEESRKTQGGRS